MNIQTYLNNYEQKYPLESATVQQFSEFLTKTGGTTSRLEYDPGHFTCSGFVIHQNFLLLVKHKKIGKWLQPGGHIEGEWPSITESIREVLEETGISAKSILGDDWFDIDRHWIPQSLKEPGHFHYDIRYLLIADQVDVMPCLNETDGAKFVEFSSLGDYSKEVSIIRPVKKILEMSSELKIEAFPQN